jgi:alkanesulfonate monooxygenase SsuD/methylene tetrahydromethanopterin reductase-like flavin-dependent oxidoreductase (luciferase family)
VTTTHTEPFHVSKALATLDHLSGGRAGWQVAVSTTAAEAGHVGRRAAVPPEVAWHEAGEVVDVIGRLWDSWEDGAVIRDVASARFIDAGRIHHVDFEGRQFSVTGPSTAPRPPQGQLPIVVAVDSPASSALAVATADVVVLRSGDLAGAVAGRAALLAAVTASGRDPASVRVLAEIAVALDSRVAEAPVARVELAAAAFADRMRELAADTGLDGFVVRLGCLDADVRSLAAAAGAPRTAPPATLRDRLGLPRPANRYAPPVADPAAVAPRGL